ncbi:MAG: catechol 1,2-dioxygenase [Bacteroidetes bacterium]|nr:MAG: catechol 1,2-dioxygenase [Bacteroidota bacterium]
MQRRDFLKTTALSAIAVSATGFVFFDGKRYVGDCETTSDILGPFYRPGSPVRSSLVIPGEPGTPVELSGRILHDDCSTPYPNAKIELWHCDNEGVYDNESADFRYRATAYTDREGQYAFQTILPVPYQVGKKSYRPAHFHLMISAEGYQPLVTQLYFSGDRWIGEDESASSPTAKRRILDVQTLPNGSKKVEYNVGMAAQLLVEPPVLGLLEGTYVGEKDPKNRTELFIQDRQLWVKGDQRNGMPFGASLEYIGDNTFKPAGVPRETYSVYFDVLPYGVIKMRETYRNAKGKTEVVVLVREM